MLKVSHLIGFGAGAKGGRDQFTKLLLHFDGTDASTTITDSAFIPKATSFVIGNAQLDTAQFKFGTASLLLDGTGDGVGYNAETDFVFGTGDFTIDFWMRPASVTGTHAITDWRDADGAFPYLYTNGTSLIYRANSADRITGATVLAINTWYHVALARLAGSTKLFLNGAQEGSTYTDTTNYGVGTANRPYIGVDGPTAAVFFNGWIDEYRVSKGIARWSTAFTPPTQAYF